ncbi:unnamed protein product [Diamesa hyperborea]
MALGCRMTMVKYGLFIINFFCALGGAALITVGAIPLFKVDVIKEAFPEDNPTLIPIITVVLGSIIFIISFFGCCGAIQHSPCMITVYRVSLVILMCCTFLVAGLAFFLSNKLAETATNTFKNKWDRMESDNIESQIFVQGIQKNLQCCGLNNASDWKSDFIFPPTCCADVSSTCTVDNAFNVGCSEQLYVIVFNSLMLIGWIGIIFGGILLVAVISACCLEFRLKNPNTV